MTAAEIAAAKAGFPHAAAIARCPDPDVGKTADNAVSLS
jgi:hypothetical protein